MTDVIEGRPRPAATLTSLLVDAMPTWDELHDRYGALLNLVNNVLGVVPNCDRYLEIWPPAFRTYNVIVPNLLNLPAPVLGIGGAPADVVGLAMYVASRTAQCPYCSAHSCSFAMRRGAPPEKVAAALLPDRAGFTRGELAAVTVARSLARVPCALTIAERDELCDVFGDDHAEWIVLAIAMMGFLNKFMDAVGVELEQSVVSEVARTMGADWSPGKAGALLDPESPLQAPPAKDGLRTKLRMIPLLPAVIATTGGHSAAFPAGGPPSAASSTMPAATISRCWHACDRTALAAPSLRCSTRTSIPSRRSSAWKSRFSPALSSPPSSATATSRKTFEPSETVKGSMPNSWTTQCDSHGATTQPCRWTGRPRQCFSSPESPPRARRRSTPPRWPNARGRC